MSGQNQPISTQQHSPQVPTSFHQSNAIDLRELVRALWDSKLIVILVTLAFTSVAGSYALYKPNIYQAQATLFVVQGFYSAEGVAEPSYSASFFSGKNLRREIEELAQQSNLSDVEISFDRHSGVVSVIRQSTDPQYAFERVQLVSSVLNDALKNLEVDKVNLAVDVLELQLEQFQSSKGDGFLGKMYAQQIFKKVLLENQSSKLVQVLSTPTRPTSHIKPRRALIILTGMLIGFMVGVAVVLVRLAYQDEHNKL